VVEIIAGRAGAYAHSGERPRARCRAARAGASAGTYAGRDNRPGRRRFSEHRPAAVLQPDGRVDARMDKGPVNQFKADNT
jgi:hypothetical protein